MTAGAANSLCSLFSVDRPDTDQEPTRCRLRPSFAARSRTRSSILLIKGGIPPWRMGWSVHPNGKGMPANAATGRNYNGINVLLLQLHSRRFGFTSRYYATFNQWRDRNCTVKPRPAGVEAGAYGCHIILFKPVEKTETDEKTGESKDIKFPMMRSFVVFSADQVQGAEKWQVPANFGYRRFPRLRTSRVGHRGDRRCHQVRGQPCVLQPRPRFHPVPAQGAVHRRQGVLRDALSRTRPLERVPAELEGRVQRR